MKDLMMIPARWLEGQGPKPTKQKPKVLLEFESLKGFFTISNFIVADGLKLNGTETMEETNDPFVLTTLLYYVNFPPHMGSAYTTIAADAIARFQIFRLEFDLEGLILIAYVLRQRLLGKKVIFITGTDEHGEKIAATAAASGSRLLVLLDIAYDKFIWTTDPKHEAVVKEFYSRVLADIYKADYEVLFCVNCEEYKDEKDLLQNHCCPIHLKPCLARKEYNYFFALSKSQIKLPIMGEIHPSNLDHELELKSYDKVYIYNGCKELGIGSRYRCEQCDFDLHEDCMFPKPTTHHALFKNSTFKFFSQSPGGHCERYCDACGKHVRGFVYHCEEQGWDLHPSCVNLPSKLEVDDVEFKLFDKALSKCLWCKKRSLEGSALGT
ncbi:hypothetical protein EZV62_025611 [Acer yangbiense]|uniref:Methionyl/Leucyl tRNA synthetase domain-containing protein n=1 Tax=Acer yangbiense TaxID=1000413 RepID=A0A5C7H0D4_9ROSI|nr:hypothetical protein EZV62_025611 [Acer yangbiense]